MSEYTSEERLFRKLEVYTLYLDDHDYDVQLHEKSEILSVNLIKVDFGTDIKKRERIMTLIFIPVDEDAELQVDFLQFYIEFDYTVEESQKLEVFTLLNELNNEGNIGSFGLNDLNKIYLKAVLVDQVDGLFEEEQVVKTAEIMAYSMDYYTPLFDEYFDGTFSVDDIIAALSS